MRSPAPSWPYNWTSITCPTPALTRAGPIVCGGTWQACWTEKRRPHQPCPELTALALTLTARSPPPSLGSGGALGLSVVFAAATVQPTVPALTTLTTGPPVATAWNLPTTPTTNHSPPPLRLHLVVAGRCPRRHPAPGLLLAMATGDADITATTTTADPVAPTTMPGDHPRGRGTPTPSQLPLSGRSDEVSSLI